MDNTVTHNITEQDLMGNDSLLVSYYDSLLGTSHDSLLGSNYDSLLESFWLQELSQPGYEKLVWAPWRNNQAFTTVSINTAATLHCPETQGSMSSTSSPGGGLKILN